MTFWLGIWNARDCWKNVGPCNLTAGWLLPNYYGEEDVWNCNSWHVLPKSAEFPSKKTEWCNDAENSNEGKQLTLHLDKNWCCNQFWTAAWQFFQLPLTPRKQKVIDVKFWRRNKLEMEQTVTEFTQQRLWLMGDSVDSTLLHFCH